MIKRTVTYEDYDNNVRIETLYFNLNQTELVEMAMDLPDTVSNKIGNDPNKVDSEAVAIGMIEALGQKGIINFIKTLLLKSYGIKSEDGRRFEKSEEISKDFSQTLAFDTILMELLSDDKAASDFVNGIIPAKTIEKMGAMNKNTQALPMK